VSDYQPDRVPIARPRVIGAPAPEPGDNRQLAACLHCPWTTGDQNPDVVAARAREHKAQHRAGAIPASMNLPKGTNP